MSMSTLSSILILYTTNHIDRPQKTLNKYLSYTFRVPLSSVVILSLDLGLTTLIYQSYKLP